MLSPENLNRFIVWFVLCSLVLVYGTLLITVTPVADAEIPENCTSGCPTRHSGGDYRIQGVIECLYTDGELYESRLYLGEFIRVCEITEESFDVTEQRLVTY